MDPQAAMDRRSHSRGREYAMVATLTLLTLLFLPLLVVAGTLYYAASVVVLNLIVFGESAKLVYRSAAETRPSA